MTVANTRRVWSRAEKLAMVAETAASAVSVVARRHNIASSLLFRWRRELGSKDARPASERSFIPVALPAPLATHEAGPGAGETIEIVLAGGRRVLVGKNVDVTALRRVIEALEPR